MVAIGRISSLLLSTGVVLSMTSTAIGQQSGTARPVEPPPAGIGGPHNNTTTEEGGPGLTGPGGSNPSPPSTRDEPTPSPTTTAASMDTTRAQTGQTPLSSFELPRTAPPTPAFLGAGTGQSPPTSDPTPAPTITAKFLGTPAAAEMNDGETAAPAADLVPSPFAFDLPRTSAPAMVSYSGAPTSAPTGSAGVYGAPTTARTATFSPTFDETSWIGSGYSVAPTPSPTSAEYMEAATSSPTALAGDSMVVRMLLKSMFGSKSQASSPSSADAEGSTQIGPDEGEADNSTPAEASSSAVAAQGGVGIGEPHVDGEGSKDAHSYASKATRALRGAP